MAALSSFTRPITLQLYSAGSLMPHADMLGNDIVSSEGEFESHLV